MDSFKGMTIAQVREKYPVYDAKELEAVLTRELSRFDRTVVVLDDDPTGTQTVSGVPVVTSWEQSLLQEELRKKPRMLFILTNSRALTAAQSQALHRELAENLLAAAKACGREFLLISRGDSTLRGHFPLETQTLREVLEAHGRQVDGEILCPFFQEGGRFTAGNIHYLEEDGLLKPVGESEFAADKTFGYRSSHLGEWIEEKTGGAYPAENVRYIALEDLRTGNREQVRAVLEQAQKFEKIVVNAISYQDLECFVPELLKTIAEGKTFLLRTASSILRVLAGCRGGVLTRQELTDTENTNGGVVIVGSHVKKTTRQLERLLEGGSILPLEFNQHLVLDAEAFCREIQRVSDAADQAIAQGKNVAIYTRRERLDLNAADKEDELRLATRISEGVVQIIADLKIRPNFIIAKGGITSSDVATQGLSLRRAMVMGQILPGIPVWRTGQESKFPGMPYVIFPGNVGDENSLLDAVKKLAPDPASEKE